MKNFIIDYIEEIIHFLALVLICISAFFISLALGLFITGLMLMLGERKIIEIKKSLAERR